MKKYFLIAVMFLGFCSQVLCQNFGTDPRDSIRYDSLKRMLPHTEGREKVNLLNSISEMSGLIGSGWDTVKMRRKYDTIKHYASRAYKLATTIGYSDGIAMALVNLNQHGSPESTYQVPLKDRDVREKNIRAAIAIAEKTKNYEILGQAYGALGTLSTPFQPDSQWIERLAKQEYYFKLVKDSEALANIYVWATEGYSQIGNNEKMFEYGEKSLEYLKFEEVKYVNWHQMLVQIILGDMSDLYSSIGDYENAIRYSKEQNNYGLKNHTGWTNNAGIAKLFCDFHQYDSAMIYWQLWRNDSAYSSSAEGSKAWGYGILADINIVDKKYDSAILISKENINRYKIFNNHTGIAIEMKRLAQAYDKKGDYDSALYYVTTAVSDFERFYNRPLMMESYLLLSSVYHQKRNNDSAYKYLVKYVALKDSIDNKQFLLRLYKQKLDANSQQTKASLILLNKDNALKSEQLKQGSQQKKFLLILLFVLTLTGIFVYRSIYLKRKN